MDICLFKDILVPKNSATDNIWTNVVLTGKILDIIQSNSLFFLGDNIKPDT